MQDHSRTAALAAAMSLPLAGAAAAQEAPVKVIADQRLEIVTAEGRGLLPVMASLPLDQAAPSVKRVIVTLHGALRNVNDYFAAGEEAVRAGGDAARDTLVVAPQFLTAADIDAFNLPSATLRWQQSAWRMGREAASPIPLSSFAALDALIAHFADRSRYPQLKEVMLLGHSAGGQLLQRYAVVGLGEEQLRQSEINMRYVVSNPSSYLYFTTDRPLPSGGFAPADEVACPQLARWHYGFGDAPAYVTSQGAKDFEASYVARDVTYLLGMADTDPNHRLLDRSCAGLAQGPYRLARGLAYFAYLASRHPNGLRQRLVEVPAVGHNDRAIYNSPCGLAVLFGRDLPASCPRQP